MMGKMDMRREVRNVAGRFRGGKLAPVYALPFLGGEGGMVSQTATIELDTIAGRLLTPVTAELIAVYVPVQALDYVKAPDADHAGLTDVVRKKLLAGTPLFGLENETEISKRMRVNPASIAGVKKVSEMPRLAYIAAVNFLRKSKYAYAVELLHTSTAIAPALISQTILERMNGVLDPDDRVNGSVQLTLATMQLPVSGIGFRNTPTSAPGTYRESTALGTSFTNAIDTSDIEGGIRYTGTGAAIRPDVYAVFDGAQAGGVSLTDFYNAQKQDQLIRAMRSMIDANPIDGEEQVLRSVMGLKLETDHHPFLLHKSEKVFGQDFQRGSDGASLVADVAASKMMVQMGFQAVVPPTELGGIVVTIMTVKPDETIAAMPHPILSQPWGVINHAADQLKLDPVAVTMRELDSDVTIGNEAAVAFYVGHNGLKRLYVDYGFNRHLDVSTVENRSAIWQYAIPASVSPDNINYPADLDHYPFADQLAEVAIYSISSTAAITTPLFFGPSPVETVDIVTTESLLP